MSLKEIRSKYRNFGTPNLFYQETLILAKYELVSLTNKDDISSTAPVGFNSE